MRSQARSRRVDQRERETVVHRHRRGLGDLAEDIIESALLIQNLTCVARNVHAAGGEIDLICRETASAEELPSIVFVEVRSRKNDRFGTPLASVGRCKRTHLIRAATAWLARVGLLDKCVVRFDVVAVIGSVDDPQRCRIEWINNAFDAQGY
jgi:putative endonuclease